jgi:hypothetical protein
MTVNVIRNDLPAPFGSTLVKTLFMTVCLSIGAQVPAHVAGTNLTELSAARSGYAVAEKARAPGRNCDSIDPSRCVGAANHCPSDHPSVVAHSPANRESTSEVDGSSAPGFGR